MGQIAFGLVFFAVALAGAGVLSGFMIRSLVAERFAFWPPPRDRSWQDYTFWGLFRLHCGAIALTAFFDSGTLEWDHWTRLATGIPVIVGCFGLTLYGYGFLGLDNTYGRRAGLVTGGIYAWCRNPQYVTSVAGTIGVAITFDSPLTLILAAVLLGIYALCALNEERWLLERYGQRYAEYVERVPRFLDHRSVARAHQALVERL